MRRFRGRFMMAAIALAWAWAAHAEESAPIATPHATVTLVSETAAVEPGKPFRLGLRFKLAKGWHIYWTNPGAAGEPPQLDLGSAGRRQSVGHCLADAGARAAKRRGDELCLSR